MTPSTPNSPSPLRELREAKKLKKLQARDAVPPVRPPFLNLASIVSDLPPPELTEPAAPPRRPAVDRQRLEELVKEAESRSCEALKIYEAIPELEPFHASNAWERLVWGSNRAGKVAGAWPKSPVR